MVVVGGSPLSAGAADNGMTPPPYVPAGNVMAQREKSTESEIKTQRKSE